MNMLDRALAVFSPRLALDRARARRAIEVLESVRGYDGGSISRRLPRAAPSTSVNTELSSVSIERLRARARDMVRNNGYMSRALDIWASNVVGAGIVPASRTGSKSKDRKVNDLWKRFVEECDPNRQIDFYGQQALAVRAAFEGGDTLARLRVRRAGDGLKIPLQIQLMESDHLDATRHGIIEGGRSVLGVAFDGLGGRAGYWLFSEHPGDRGQFALGPTQSFSSRFVPAADVVHLYRIARIGQVRGVSGFAPVVLQAKDLAELQDAVIVKARVEACFAGFIISEELDGGDVGPKTADANGNQVQELQPGIIRRLKPGESIDFAEPTSSTNFDPVMLHTLMGIAVGLGLTYDQLTGDLRQANYSSLRAGKIEMRRLIEQVQYQTVIPMFCRPIWRRFIDMAIFMGELTGTAEQYPCEWIAPAHEAIDPVKDLQADIMAVRSGRMTVKQFIAGWGNDPDTQLEEIAASNKLLDDLELTLDIDPRRVSQAGLVQQEPQAQAEAPPPPARELPPQLPPTPPVPPVINVDARTETRPQINVFGAPAGPKRTRNIVRKRGPGGRIEQLEHIENEGTPEERRFLTTLTQSGAKGETEEFTREEIET